MNKRLKPLHVAIGTAVVLLIVVALNFDAVSEAATWLRTPSWAIASTFAFFLLYVGVWFGELADLQGKWRPRIIRTILIFLAVAVFGWLAIQNVLVTYINAEIPTEALEPIQEITGYEARGATFVWALADASVRVIIEVGLAVVVSLVLSMPAPKSTRLAPTAKPTARPVHIAAPNSPPTPEEDDLDDIAQIQTTDSSLGSDGKDK